MHVWRLAKVVKLNSATGCSSSATYHVHNCPVFCIQTRLLCYGVYQ